MAGEKVAEVAEDVIDKVLERGNKGTEEEKKGGFEIGDLLSGDSGKKDDSKEKKGGFEIGDLLSGDSGKKDDSKDGVGESFTNPTSLVHDVQKAYDMRCKFIYIFQQGEMERALHKI